MSKRRSAMARNQSSGRRDRMTDHGQSKRLKELAAKAGPRSSKVLRKKKKNHSPVTMPFGLYKNQSFTIIPTEYLYRILQQGNLEERISDAVTDELVKRECPKRS